MNAAKDLMEKLKRQQFKDFVNDLNKAKQTIIEER